MAPRTTLAEVKRTNDLIARLRRERDEARAEIVRLRAELDERPPGDQERGALAGRQLHQPNETVCANCGQGHQRWGSLYCSKRCQEEDGG